jgi:hypothetical protein
VSVTPPQTPEPPEDAAHRTLINLIAAIFVLALAIAAFWLLKTLDERRKLENCLASGRRDCIPIDDSAVRH